MSPVLTEKIEKGDVITDISTFINTTKLLSKEVKLSGFRLFDLSTFIDSLILGESVVILQPGDWRYSNRKFMEWALSNEIVKDLMEKDILRIHESEGYDFRLRDLNLMIFGNEILRHKIREFFFDLLEQPDSSTYIRNLSLGIDQEVLRYNKFYMGLYGKFIKENQKQLPHFQDIDPGNLEDYSHLMYRTLQCLEYSGLHEIPYLPHSLKVPLTEWLNYGLKERTVFLAKSAWIQMSENIDEKTKKLARLMKPEEYEVKVPPLLPIILENCDSLKNIYDYILEFRNEPKIRNFRKKMKEFQIKLEKGTTEEKLKIYGKLDYMYDEIIGEIMGKETAYQKMKVKRITWLFSLLFKSLIGSFPIVESVVEIILMGRDIENVDNRKQLSFLFDFKSKIDSIQNYEDLIRRIFNEKLSMRDKELFKRLYFYTNDVTDQNLNFEKVGVPTVPEWEAASIKEFENELLGWFEYYLGYRHLEEIYRIVKHEKSFWDDILKVREDETISYPRKEWLKIRLVDSFLRGKFNRFLNLKKCQQIFEGIDFRDSLSQKDRNEILKSANEILERCAKFQEMIDKAKDIEELNRIQKNPEWFTLFEIHTYFTPQLVNNMIIERKIKFKKKKRN